MKLPDRWAGANVIDVSNLPPEVQAEVRLIASVKNWSAVEGQAKAMAVDLVRKAKAATLTRTGALRWLYELIPASGCAVGDCADSCATIAMTPLEEAIIERATGVDPESFGECKVCPLLQDDGACGGYDVRPLVCRLFGVVPEMRCSTPGCLPPRVLSTAEGLAILLAVNEIGGANRLAPPAR